MTSWPAGRIMFAAICMHNDPNLTSHIFTVTFALFSRGRVCELDTADTNFNILEGIKMYTFLLAVHNLLRWVALFLGIFVIVRSVGGWLGSRAWSETDRKAGVFFTAAMDTQLLLGLLLYIFFSPLTKAALSDFGTAMRTDGLRFFALEHPFYMLLSLVFAHLGSILPKRLDEARAKHQRAAIFFILAGLTLLLGMPWMRSVFPNF